MSRSTVWVHLVASQLLLSQKRITLGDDALVERSDCYRKYKDNIRAPTYVCRYRYYTMGQKAEE